MADKIQINMLGEFTLTYRDKVVSDKDNRSKKVWTLLEYLIAFHSESITHDALIELLWHGTDNNVDSENALKTILHRTRSTLDILGYTDHKLILHRRETYSWNNAAAFEVDIDHFKEACTQAANPNLSVRERLTHYYTAFDLYKGKFLPKNGEDDWIIPISDYYHSLYINAVHNMIELLLAEEQYSEIIRICAKASSIDPYDEPIHYHFIRCLYMTGKQKEAVEKYQYVMKLFYDKFGINPSEEITNLYQEIIQEEQSPVTDLNIIKEKLREQDAQKRAYLCDFSVFQNLYRIEARSAARNGLSVFLCLITIGVNRNTGDNALMAAAMERMADTIGQSLRAGDVYARYSVNQYIIMLSAASYENCTMIGNRIMKSFDNSKPKLNVTASFMLNELEPITFDSPHEAEGSEARE